MSIDSDGFEWKEQPHDFLGPRKLTCQYLVLFLHGYKVIKAP